MSTESRAEAPFSPPDVQWEKYVGSIPEGAIVCGTDDNGQNVYAGRVYFKNELLIGSASLQSGQCVFSRDGVIHESSDFEVMCVPVGEPLDWEKVGPSTDFHELSLLCAGKTNNDEVLFIGRIMDNGKSYVGWVNTEEKLAYIPKKGTEVVCKEFEICVHKFLQFLCICPPCPPNYPKCEN